MKDSGFFNKRDFFEFLAKGSMNAKDEYLQQDFNSIQQILLTKSGKARAWIRKTINEGHLATSLYSLASDREFIKSWYEPYAIMSTNAINDLYKEIEKLEEFHFQFNLKDSMLDKDDIFELPPSQYRGQNELVRLKEDTDDENTNDDNKKSAKKKKKKKKERKERMKRAKSTRNANLNEVVDEQQNATNLTVDLDPNKSMSPISDNDSTPKKKKKKPKKDKKKKKKKKEYSKSSMNVLNGQEQEQDDADDDNEDNNDENVNNNNNPDIMNEDEEEIDNINQERKPSLKEWQEQHTSNISIPTPQKTKSEQSLITPVNVNKSKSSNQRQSARPKSGSISDRMKAQLSGITIKMDGNYDEADKEDKPFRISSPSDYHTSFKWNDVSKDISSQKINKLYDHEHNPKNKKSFPDPDEYEEKEKQFLEQLDHDDEDDMDDNELEKQISVLIENAPNDGQEDPELQLSSDEYDDDDNDSGIVASIPEDIEHDQDMPSKVGPNNKSLFYSPKEDKSSTATSATSDSAPYQSQGLTESKREEILNTNDEYHRRKQQQQQQQQQQQLSNINEQEKYAPECQTFIHFTHNNQNALSTDPTKNSLNIYLQSDNYFDDENQLRDRRKKEQDKESKKRMQREQDVMRGNDSVSIQKSLNSSGMSASGGHDNKPLDNSGNYLVLPSTGIILDATMNKSSEDFFVEQNGQCFSCGDHLGSPQMSRQCYYTQRLFCALCMDGTLNNIIPSKIIHSLDTRKYAISTNSKKHLDSMYDVPAVPLSKIELPSWYIPTDSTNISILKNDKQEVPEINNTMPNQNEKYYKLIKLGEYLEILSYIKQYYYNNKECYEINNTVQTALGRRPYLLDAYQTDKDSFGYFLKIIDEHQEDDLDKNRNKANIKSIHKTKQSKYRLYGLISMRDMFELFNKDLLTTMHHTQQQITNHIKSCKHCKKRSYGANVQFISKFSEVLQ